MIKEKDFPDGGWKKEGDGAMRKEIRYQMILWAMAAAVSGCGNVRGASIAAEEKRTAAESGQSMEAFGRRSWIQRKKLPAQGNPGMLAPGRRSRQSQRLVSSRE